MSSKDIDIDYSKLLGFDMLTFSGQNQRANMGNLQLDSGENFNKIGELGESPLPELGHSLNKIGTEADGLLANTLNKVGEET